MLKRAFDLAACIVTLPLTLPVIAVIALLVRLDSTGPVFYRGVRTGRFGRTFRIFKFRSMVTDAERLGGGTTALGDPRITRVGGVLRRYKLDELPQVFNVISGEMSLVGPRPELPEYTERYADDEKLILTVRPGITDYSSIEFSSLDQHVGAVDADRVFEETVLPRKNRLRVQYVREQSFATDLRILFKTIWALALKLRGSGAA